MGRIWDKSRLELGRQRAGRVQGRMLGRVGEELGRSGTERNNPLI